MAQALAARGIDSLIEPLLGIEPVPGAAVDPTGLQGLLVTSANGARAVARLLPDRSLPVWAVGDSSARAARALGFEHVESAGGDVETLADLVQARVDPSAGALLHAQQHPFRLNPSSLSLPHPQRIRHPRPDRGDAGARPVFLSPHRRHIC